MRKQFKIKKRSCALCKPNKIGWAKRWKDKELMLLKEFEFEKEKSTLKTPVTLAFLLSPII